VKKVKHALLRGYYFYNWFVDETSYKKERMKRRDRTKIS